MFIDRDEADVIVAIHAVQQHDGQEQIADDSPEAAAFYARLAAIRTVPGQVSAGQLIKALAELDLLDAVDAAVEQADPMTKRLWARAAFFPRADPIVTGMATALGKSSSDLDEIFRLAATK